MLMLLLMLALIHSTLQFVQLRAGLECFQRL
jgi:hypothetical protein